MLTLLNGIARNYSGEGKSVILWVIWTVVLALVVIYPVALAQLVPEPVADDEMMENLFTILLVAGGMGVMGLGLAYGSWRAYEFMPGIGAEKLGQEPVVQVLTMKVLAWFFIHFALCAGVFVYIATNELVHYLVYAVPFAVAMLVMRPDMETWVRQVEERSKR